MDSNLAWELNPVNFSSILWRVHIEKDFGARKSIHVHYCFNKSELTDFLIQIRNPERLVQSKVLSVDKYELTETVKPNDKDESFFQFLEDPKVPGKG